MFLVLAKCLACYFFQVNVGLPQVQKEGIIVVCRWLCKSLDSSPAVSTTFMHLHEVQDCCPCLECGKLSCPESKPGFLTYDRSIPYP